MGRSPCCSKVGLNKGAWTTAEDKILTDYIHLYGEGGWRNLPKRAGKHAYIIISENKYLFFRYKFCRINHVCVYLIIEFEMKLYI